MSSPPRGAAGAIKVIQSAPGKKVLIVEGEYDLAIYPKWLARLAAPNIWEDKLGLVEAGGKEGVLESLRWLTDFGGSPSEVFGLVDRDEWDEAKCVQNNAELPQLIVNSERHALENYFCDPDEIETVLDRLELTDATRRTALRRKIEGELPKYKDHWALLTATDRLKVRMVEQGYPGYFANSIPIPNDEEIKTRFDEWAATVDSAAAFAEFDQLRTMARAAARSKAYASHVWGKNFFAKVVYASQNGLKDIQDKSLKDWLVDLAEYSAQVPSDFSALLQPLVA